MLSQRQGFFLSRAEEQRACCKGTVWDLWHGLRRPSRDTSSLSGTGVGCMIIYTSCGFMQGQIYSSQLFLLLSFSTECRVLFPGGESGPSIKELPWATLLRSLLDKNCGHTEVAPGTVSLRMEADKAGPSPAAALSQFNSAVPPALGDKALLVRDSACPLLLLHGQASYNTDTRPW